MYVIDTNVLSEEMRGAPDAAVHAWLGAQAPIDLFTTSVTEAELLYGVAALADGRRKSDLEMAVRRIMTLFSGRVLPFDSSAAAHLPAVLLDRKRLGRPIASHDALIVAIAISRGMKIVTRDIEGFADCGVTLINPWSS